MGSLVECSDRLPAGTALYTAYRPGTGTVPMCWYRARGVGRCAEREKRTYHPAPPGTPTRHALHVRCTPSPRRLCAVSVRLILHSFIRGPVSPSTACR